MISPPSFPGRRPFRAATAADDVATTTLLDELAPPAFGVPDASAPSTSAAPETQAVRPVDWATVPRVNLLPQEIIDARRFRTVQRALVVVVAVVVVLCALATGWAQTDVSSARVSLEATRAETLGLQREQARYAEVPKVSADLDQARAAREAALGKDVLWYRFLTDLAVNTPDRTALSSVTITMNVSGGQSTTSVTGSQAPASSGLGSVTVSGKANRFVDVAAWLDAAARVNGLTDTSLQSAVREDGGSASWKITYAGSAVISSAALSHRYDRRAS
jgi:Tfp pilus assembly protein PilN